MQKSVHMFTFIYSHVNFMYHKLERLVTTDLIIEKNSEFKSL